MLYFICGLVAGIALHPTYLKFVKPVLVARGILPLRDINTDEREPDSSDSST